MANNQTKEYLTKEKYDELQQELEHLKTDKRKEVADTLEYAKSLGDFSENAEYDEARDMQAQVENRIAELESILQSAEIVSHHQTDMVTVGSEVTVRRGDSSKKEVYTIVGSEETDTESGKISVNAPVGKGLLNRKKGETVKISIPAGEVEFEVLDIK